VSWTSLGAGPSPRTATEAGAKAAPRAFGWARVWEELRRGPVPAKEGSDGERPWRAAVGHSRAPAPLLYGEMGAGEAFPQGYEGRGGSRGQPGGRQQPFAQHSANTSIYGVTRGARCAAWRGLSAPRDPRLPAGHGKAPGGRAVPLAPGCFSAAPRRRSPRAPSPGAAGSCWKRPFAALPGRAAAERQRRGGDPGWRHLQHRAWAGAEPERTPPPSAGRVGGRHHDHLGR